MSRRVAARIALSLAIFLVAGCSTPAGQAARYRAEAMLHKARRDEAKLRIAGSRPDSASLLKLRQSYRKLRETFQPPFAPGSGEMSRRLAREVIRQVGQAELEAGRLAMEARNPALALESVQWVASVAGADTGLHREADLSAVVALQRLRRFDDAVSLMRSMLERYPPAPPPDPSKEDAILKIPDAIVALRRDLGDTASVRAELRFAERYYRSLLARRPPALLEQQLRARLVRAYLELGDARGAMGELTELERLTASTPALAGFTPEVLHSKARVQAVVNRDPRPALALYDRIVTLYPESPFAPLSLLDGGVLEEQHGRLGEAVLRYRQALTAYPKDEMAAPIALFRLAMIQDATGDWASAKQSLESLPLRFPRSRAAAEAPLAIVAHYKRVGERQAQRTALTRAVQTYQKLVADDSTAAVTLLFRWNIVRAQIAGENWQGALAAIDDIAAKDRGSPLAAQALLEGVRIARIAGEKERSAAYLERLKVEYPGLKVRKR